MAQKPAARPRTRPFFLPLLFPWPSPSQPEVEPEPNPSRPRRGFLDVRTKESRVDPINRSPSIPASTYTPSRSHSSPTSPDFCCRKPSSKSTSSTRRLLPPRDRATTCRASWRRAAASRPRPDRSRCPEQSRDAAEVVFPPPVDTRNRQPTPLARDTLVRLPVCSSIFSH